MTSSWNDDEPDKIAIKEAMKSETTFLKGFYCSQIFKEVPGSTTPPMTP
jgi:hypothetical protein